MFSCTYFDKKPRRLWDALESSVKCSNSYRDVTGVVCNDFMGQELSQKPEIITTPQKNIAEYHQKLYSTSCSNIPDSRNLRAVLAEPYLKIDWNLQTAPDSEFSKLLENDHFASLVFNFRAPLASGVGAGVESRRDSHPRGIPDARELS